MSQELELQELQELIEELDEKHTMESSRQDHTTWVMQDLIKIMKLCLNTYLHYLIQ